MGKKIWMWSCPECGRREERIEAFTSKQVTRQIRDEHARLIGTKDETQYFCCKEHKLITKCQIIRF